MRLTISLLLVTFISVQGTLHAEVPLMSKEELNEGATHIVVGVVQRIFSTTAERENWRDTIFVAEIAVEKAEKGDRIQPGDVVYDVGANIGMISCQCRRQLAAIEGYLAPQTSSNSDRRSAAASALSAR